MINLDCASHTPIDERVLAEFCRVERDFPGNVMAAHTAGRKAMEEMERVTNGIAELLNVQPQEIIFTSGASEANNLAIKGIAKAYEYEGKHILSTCLEHPSVSGTLSALQLSGYEIELLKILPNGNIDTAHLKTVMRRDTVLICISAADSELGAIQPISDILEILEAHPHCHLHVDAAQAMGKTPLGQMHSASTFCFSPHKFHGPCGVGVLVKREGVVLEPLIHGGRSTTIYRSGTPALSLAAATYMALKLSFNEMDERLEVVKRTREYVLDGLKPFPLVRINSPIDGSPYILNISVSGIKGIDFQAALDRHGICVSVKSACSTDRAPSRPVMAISHDKKNALASWRISFCHLTTTREIDTFLSAFTQIYKELSPNEKRTNPHSANRAQHS